MVHVIDTPALLSIAQYVKSSTDENLVLQEFSVHVQNGDLTFPREVAKEVQQRAAGLPVATWISSAHANRCQKAVDYQNNRWVLKQCPTLCDPNQLDDSPAYVAAFARHFADTPPVHVVTEDRTTKPTRMSLVEACTALQWHHESLPDYLRCIGLQKHLKPGV